jgi:hypothetical protein
MKYQYDIFFEASKLTMTAILCKGGIAFARELIELYGTRKESE